ncbi:sulfate ABC transporter substrate-binding protein [Alicyclobacillus cycloheptanicus]|uniref:Sulfate transport system substrate-binding protein n=1 Tax=Alicyclobacillus cycloheptanicus TaxID=1457 RepID=A0ABT9XGZ0_9BACL|nr:sulfate ABC transporter substrate-binding protein [Alicyclobacillus cycloheptanicus]MDQ0189581.1 sulfate transport system substrate-binding protein [Alicyclobacillus cycloheptanicus]WDL99892.1 sulfate ABC transporter substrate-binding protein [Alicyclobacillus cycloheptanicus]
MKKSGLVGLVVLGAVGLVGCGAQTSGTSGNSSSTSGAPKTVTLNVGSYSVTQDVYENKLFPAFAKYWKDKTGQTVVFKASFQASGSEAQAIASGLPVDVAALSSETDMDKIQQAGLITHNWQDTPTHGMVTDSVVAIGVRKGNPKHIETWSDLAKPGVVVDLPNPSTSGGAKWDINALYYAALRHGNAASAKTLLSDILKNVQVLDKSGEASMTTFTNGTGDAVVSYENEILEASDNGKKFTEVLPSSTMLIENPIAVVDKNVDADGTRQVATAFVNWLESPTAQKIFMQDGFRPVIPQLQAQAKQQFKTPADLFTVKELGGWSTINKTLYSTNGIWNQVLESK